jgi:hypothetical protein
MGAKVEFIFFGLSIMPMGEQHAQESRNTELCPVGQHYAQGGIIMPRGQHHAQGGSIMPRGIAS